MADGWMRIKVTSPSEELTGLLAEGLLACGGSAIEERDGALVTYIRPGDDTEGEIARIRASLRTALGAEPLEFSAQHVPEQDWLALWRTGLEPRRVGPRVIVSPTWSDVDPANDDIVIRIDPQMAFGTGEHASTRGVLRLMQRIDPGGDTLVDVGSGSGILAIAAVLLGAAHVTAVESDAEAMPNAHENIERNGVADRVTLVCETADDAFLGAFGGGAFDGILANVLSSVLLPLLPAFHRALAANGWAILAGILAEEAPAMRDAAVAAGFTVESEDTEEQWWCVMLRRS